MAQDVLCSSLALLVRSMAWEYYGGSHFQNVRHNESAWRSCPFLVAVCPVEGLYSSKIEGLGKVTIGPGEALLAPAGVKHTVAMPAGGILHHAHIQFTVFGTVDVLKFFNVPCHVKGKLALSISDAVRDLHAAVAQKDERLNAFAASAKLNELAWRLLSLVADASTLNEGSFSQIGAISRIESVMRYIDQHFAERVSRHLLAKMAALSDTRFHYVFKCATGLAPLAYLKGIRLRKAQALLLKTDLQIAEVGEKTGYPDICHFSKVFKNAFHLTPSEYRSLAKRWLVEENGRG